MSTPLRVPSPLPSLVQVLRARAIERPEGWAYTFLADGEGEGERLTYGELDRRARAIAARLAELDLEGERALLLYPPGLEFVAAFLGCLYAGVVAVPAYPPRSSRMLPRLQAIAGDSRPAAALTTSALAGSIEAMAGRLPEPTPRLGTIRWLATDGVPSALAADWREPDLDGDSLAFLQYTSGSTSQPKGVRVSHGNLLANEEAIRLGFGQSERSVIVGWLPVYHDMGLIGNVLQPLYVGAPCVLMSPVSFLQRPARWLEAVSRYRATTSGGPNFAYELCVSRIAEGERAGLDLSSWEVAFDGAEPVRAETLERFARAFEPYGFRREAFYPCYGLAEATLFVTGGRVGAGATVEAFRAAALEKDRVAAARAGEPARTLVGCGQAWEDQEVQVVDPETSRRCPPDRVGEIWVRGPSVAQGYWERPEETARTFGAVLEGEGPWLRTGDLGFLRDGELYVTGRLKDLIILRGRNHYPQDLELTAERSHPALKAGGSAAFAVEVEAGPGGEERLVVAAEIDRRREKEAGEAAEAVRRAIAEEHEVAVWEVVLLRAGSLPKTSSGKVQRHACRAGYGAGMLEVVGRSALREEVEEPEPAAEAMTAPRAWKGVEQAERRRLLAGWLRAEAARALGVSVERIDPERPLTALGLDSLAAVELKGRVEAGLELPVSLAGLLEGASLADLAAELSNRPEVGATQAPPLRASPQRDESAGASVAEGEHPLSWGQRGLWYLDRLAPESRAYHLAGAARVRGEVDAAALRRALAALAARHPALRTTFDEAEGGLPVQRVGPGSGFELVEVDAGGWSEEEAAARLRAEAWLPFDLARGPLLRAALLTGAGEPLLLLAVHHIVADFWSLAVLARDLGALYARESGAEPRPELPALSSTYADWARWQEERVAGPEGERLWEWWRERLSGELPRLEPAPDRPRPAVARWDGDARMLRLPAAAVEPVARLARDSRATLYMALLAGFQALLHRYTGAEDVVLGSPTTGRTAAGLGDMVGYFVNPVVLRTDLGGDPPFAELLGRARRTVLDAFEHQEYPFALLAERLQPERDPGRSPVFDVLFAFEKARGAEAAGLGGFALGEAGARLALGGLALESVALPPAGSPADLGLVIAEVEGGLGLALRYRTDLYDGATVERLGEHFRTLLAGAAAEPGRRLSELPLLSSEEERQLLVEWNRTGAPFPRELGLHQLVEAAAAREPGALAVVDGGERLTYGELLERSGRLARRLAGLGVGPEDRVAVCLERSAALVVAELAVLQAGAAYVPLDPSYPEARLAWMVADCGAAVVLTSERLRDRLPADGPAVLCLDDPQEESLDEASPLPPALPESLAYVIYTSGSTGTPKGVAVRHRGAVNLVRWHHEALGWSAADRGTLAAGPGFDATVIEIWPCLAAGASLHVVRDEVRGSPSGLVAWMAREGITVSFLATPLAEAVFAEAWPPDAALTRVHTGGDRLHQGPPAGLPFALVNQYGPTEATVVATWAPVAPEGAAPPIGRPVANARAYVLDRRLVPVPAGVPGELCVAGEGLARGYLGRPEATAERFLPDPFAVEAGARLYRTGDLVRQRADGNLEFLGRVDQQVKVRGFRIELGEVEAALAAHPEVRAAAVLLREAREGSLAGFVVPAEGADPVALPARLGAYLRERLPEFMVPAVLVALPALPLTRNGKVDRRALAALAPLPAPESASPPPRTPAEEKVAAVWRELLGVERVGVQDDFFALGGHSLLAARLATRLREELGVEVPLARVLAAPTVAALAWEVEAAEGLEKIWVGEKEERGEPVLSFAQERLWFLDRLEPGSALYNIPAAARLAGDLVPGALAAALGEAVRRHEVLRTTFAESGGRPVGVVAPAAPVPLPVVDLSALPAEQGELAALALAAAEARRPFDLAAGPLLRATRLRLEAGEHVLLLTLHHVVADGASLQVLLGELGALYGAFAAGLPSPLPAPRVQFATLARRERERLAGERLQSLLGFWREALAGAPQVLELPADRPRSAAQRFHGAREPVVLGAGLATGVAKLARDQGATPYMALLSAFQALLGRWTGREDLLVGSPVANRGPGAEELVGLFVNTLVLRADLTKDPPYLELLSRTRARTLAALAHQELPFERLVEELVAERSLAHAPLVQVALGLQPAPPALALPGLAVERLDVDPGTAKFDLMLDLAEEEGRLRGWIEYDRDLFEAATVRRMAGHLATLLAGAVADPGRRLSELPLLTAAERAQLLGEWNPPETARPLPLLHQPFFARAVETPDAVALVAGEERLSYGALASRAARLAARLRALGLGPEERVALLAERSPWMVEGILGTLAAGGAYVALDPAYPRERLEWILADSGARVLLKEAGLAGRLNAVGARVVPLDGREEEPDGNDADLSVAGPASLAYVIYTSGSTGTPKGVAIAHRSAAELVSWTAEAFSAEELSGVLAATSFCFDLSVFELFAALSSGGTVVLAENALALPALPAAPRVGLVNTVPSAAAELVRGGNLPAGVHTVNLAGEPLRGELARGLFALPQVRRVLNLYGPSEDTTYSTLAEVGRDDPGEPSIGRPVPNTRAYALDSRLSPLPVGVPGELFLAGCGLARGYLGRPELTAERFVPDPFGAVPGGRLYATGDLVRRRGDGELEFLGRLDHQVKVRGFRIEPGEVEAALLAHPEVGQAVVVARRDAGLDPRLVAYVAPRHPAREPSAGELRRSLGERLPAYMVPSAWVVLPALPLNANGKVDRRALPAPEPGGEERGYVAPRDEGEAWLAGLFRQVLGRERVGVHDDFFTLGGHSLLATQVVSRVREGLGVELPLRILFERPTVAGLAGEIERRLGEAVPAVSAAAGAEAVLSFAQERLWLLDRLDPGSALYNVPAAARLTGGLYVPALAGALAEVVRRHEVLRTRFVESAGKPVAVVAPPESGAGIGLPIVDLAALAPERREPAARERILTESRRPFDLAAGPLVRATLLRLGPGEHLLLVTLHHIVADGASLQRLFAELGVLYSAFARGLPSPLAPPPAQFAELAWRERERLSGERLEALLGFWRAALAGAPQVLELPADLPRPPAQRFRGAREPFAAGPEVAGGLAALAGRHGATLYMALLAAFQALLGRWSGREDLLVGSPVANRGAGAGEAIGLFVNTLVLRGDLAGDPPFVELLGRTRARTLAALAHQELPFERLVEELVRERTLAHAPLVQVVLGLQPAPPALDLPGLAVERLEIDSGAAKFDWSLDLVEGARELSGWIEYDRDLFEPATVRRMAGHLATLLAGAASEPGRRLSELPLLAAAERAELLGEWNPPEGARALPLLHEPFFTRAAEIPDAVALVAGEERLSYGALATRAARVAARLRGLGLEPEERVALLAGRSPAMVAGILGTLAAGGAYVALDPAYPRERLEWILADCGARVLLAAGGLAERLDAGGARVLPLGEEETGGAPLPAVSAMRAEAAGPASLAYVIYTSGSTGTPKGVAIAHRSAGELVSWAAEAFSAEELSGVLAATSFCFDLSVFELFAPLSLGGTVILAENALALPELPAAPRVELVNTVPSAAAELVRGGSLPAGVRTVNLAGEPLRGELARGLFALPHVERVLNLYGPSEDTTYSTLAEIGRDDPGEPSIGRPLPNTRAYALDSRLSPLPVGVPGELFLAGCGLARGYLGRPERTAERFVPDPFGAVPGGRLYATGDLVRRRAGGELEFLGRLDHQVKLRGFRIEPGEVEAALLAHPEVGQAVVLARRDAGMEPRLVAYMVSRDRRREPAPRELRRFLGERLPAHMVPSAWVLLPALPLNANGKVDRRALPAPGAAAPAAGPVAPRDAREELLAGLFAAALGREGVGVHDDFFALGGHSLLAAQVVSRVRESLGVELPLRVLFERPTVAGLAREVGRRAGEAAGATPIGRRRRTAGAGGAAPLSFAQQRLWFLELLAPGGAVYHIPAAARLRGELRVPALAGALDAVVGRHETLRSGFTADADGAPLQVVAPWRPAGLPVADLAALPGPARQAEALRLGRREARRPFDLAAGGATRLLRATLLRLAGDEHELLLTLHHIAADGWSIGVLLHEVALLYGAFAAGRPSPLPELPIQYADFALWQRETLAGERLAAELAWWRQALAGAPEEFGLPADRPRPALPSDRGAVMRRAVSPAVAAGLAALARGLEATPFMVLVAAYQALLARWTGREDLVVGTAVANRNRVEIEGLIGFFVNTLVLRLDLAGDPPFSELARRAREATLDAYAHQDLPFERLVLELAPERQSGRTPLFQTMVVLQNAPAAAPALPGIAVELQDLDSGVSRFDLLLDLADRGAGPVWSLEYSADLFDPATAARLLGQLETLLGAAAGEPGRRLSELPLLGAAERAQLLVEWADTASREAGHAVHERVARWAAAAPDAVAVEAEEERLSYGGLWQRAGRLARVLRRLGVGPDDAVAVCLERSPEAAVALLGVLAAGGAYLPLDPEYPRERLSRMLADARPRALVTAARLLPVLPGDLAGRGIAVVDVAGLGVGTGEPPGEAAAAAVDGGQLACVLFTSGSTGKPKGVAMPHAALANLIAWQLAAGSPGPLRTLQFAALSFDVSLQEVLSTWAAGGTLVVPGEPVRRDPAALLALLAERAVERLFLPFVALRQLAEAAAEAPGPPPAALCEVATAGEQLQATPAVVELFTRLPGCALQNHYGPTETHVATALALAPDPRAWPELPPIGRPIPNSYALLADRWGAPAPIGVPGELAIGGVALARGYLGRPELTAERFVPDPVAAVPGARLYVTGDLARALPDGRLEFLGRADRQVKVRGYRIEPGEVEAALAGHPAVRQAVVLARPVGTAAEPRLVAYVVAREGETGPGLAAELRRHLAASLPEPMVPALWVTLESLPLTPTGKVDRAALPDPEPPEEGFVAPRTPAEELLAGIWQKVLGVERVGARDDFFELGGHSLLVTRLASRVRRAFGVEVPLARLFEARTVEALARELRGWEGQVAPPPLRRAARGGPLPLSFAQERLWFMEQLAPEGGLYNLPALARLAGDLDLPALAAALDEIARRHEALRTVFSGAGERAVQTVLPPRPVGLAVVDLEGLPERPRAAEAGRLARGEALRPFDLAAAPPLRAVLLRLGARLHDALLTFHHIAADGWSIGVFLRELAALYPAFAAGLPSPLPELPLQYADFAVWQREWLRGEALAGLLAWWREALAGAPPVAELPLDRPRPAVRDHRGAHLPCELPAGLAAALAALARRESATPFMVLLAGFQALLARYSSREDGVVGTPVANRNRLETEPLVGFFVNTLALRLDLAGDPDLRELVRRSRTVTLGAYAHQDLPFEKLVLELAPARDARVAPLVQVLFALQNAPMPPLALPGLTVEPLEVETGIAKFDLVLSLTEREGALAGSLEYATDLFDAATARRLLGHLEVLLGAAVAAPDLRLSALPLLTAAERAELAAWAGGASPYPRDRSLPELFAAQAARTPMAPAVEFDDARLAYAELEERSNRLARHLRALGVGRETPVAVCLERSAGLVVALLAVAKAGGVYVPLDPAYPRERTALMLADAFAGAARPVLVTVEPLLGALPETGAAVVLLDRDAAEIARRSASAPAPASDPEDLLYAIYTSGSTGRPKGVAVPHRAVARLVLGTDYVRLGPEDRVAQAANPAFDAATFEIWGPLLTGGCVVGIGRETTLAPRLLAERLRELEISTLFLTTALFNQVAREVPDGFATLTHLLFGGEAVDPGLVARVLAAGPPRRLLHVYGPTESTTFATWHPVDSVPAGARTVPIGGPLANTTAHVVDLWGAPVPVGVAGELRIGGDGLARGYLGAAAATAERFVPDPWGESGARLYRTGDLVRRTADGAIEFLGRIDDQVKIRGFRVEPGEVAAALAAHPGVSQATVAVRPGPGGDRRLAAWVVAREDAAPDLPAALARFLRERLPEPMVPAAIAVVGALPMTATGKVDRRALPDPEWGAGGREERTPPRTPVEELVAGVWCELLGAERVGVEEDFFALGGHSLLATQAVSRLREVLGVEVPLRALFETPTVEGIAAEVEARRGSAEAAEPMLPLPRGGPLPLSFAQERLWFLDRLDPAGIAYNLDLAVRLRGPLRSALLGACLREVVRRHEALRTTFAAEGGRPLQAVGPPYDPGPPLVDLSALPAPRREPHARRLAAAGARRPFDLARGPLLRATLLRLERDEHLLLFDLHHIVADGWSLGVLLRELSALYPAFGSERPSPLPELPIQYADFAAWQRRRLAGDFLESQLAYWRARLAGAPPALALPGDRSRPARRTTAGGQEALALPAPLARRLEALARAEGATLFMVLLSGFAALLSRHGAGDDLPLGSPIANRNRLETEGLIGFFVNTLVLRLDLAGGPSFRDLVARTREVCLGAYAHQDLPFEKLVAELAPERDPGHTPLFQAMFVLQTAPLALELPSLAIEPVPTAAGTAKFDLSLALARGAAGLAGEVEYSRDLFDRPTVVRLIERFRTLLAAAVAEPAAPLRELPLLGAAERQQLLREWGGSDRPLPPAPRVHQLFERQALLRPGVTAVELDGRGLTYAELDRRAERLAGRLRAAGVGPEAIVGVGLERSPDRVVALLAVLKAGGAFLPVDPAYPAARRAYLLRDSGALLLVTREALLPELPEGLTIDLLCLEEEDAGEAAPERGSPAEVPAEALAYVIYTSGSTGEPKGVGVSHAAAAVHFATMIGGYGLLPEDRVLQFASSGFDLSLEQVLSTLAVGATVVLRGELAAPADFLAYLVRQEVTVANLTTAYWHQWMRDAKSPLAAPKLRQIMAGGEAMTPEGVRRWDELWAGSHAPRLLNAYGPTETVVTATVWAASAGGRPQGAAPTEAASSNALLPAGPVPIGRPLPERSARILDRLGEPQAAGVPGELCLGGVVARGYLGRPALTAERFRPDPFAGEPGARLYHTGDLARFRPGGEIEYLGRTDQQVKVRGFRVEPGEVEAALAAHPGLRAAAVVARAAGGTPERRLIAYVVPREPAAGDGDGDGAGSVNGGGTGEGRRPLEVAELLAFLKGSLPDFMVPAAWVVLPELPLTPGGKVDRRALPDPGRGRLETGRVHVPPRTAVESVLAGLWAELLGVERVGAEDDFFELGGHSLLAAQLASRVASTFQVELPLRRLFEAPTVAGLAAAVLEREARPGQSEKIARVLLRIKSMSPERKREALRPGA